MILVTRHSCFLKMDVFVSRVLLSKRVAGRISVNIAELPYTVTRVL